MKRINLFFMLAFCTGVLAIQISAQTKKAETKLPDPRVAAALKQTQAEYELDKAGVYKVNLGINGKKRSQTAFISSTTDVIYGFEMRNVFSFAAFSKTPFPADLMSRLLEENMSHVSTWAIIKVDKDTYAIVNSIFIPADSDAKRLDAAIESVMLGADDLEARISKKDEL